MNILIETIPHETHRYTTAGDWFFEHEYRCKDCGHTEIHSKASDAIRKCPACDLPLFHNELLRIKVSDLGDWRREALLAVHELVEVLACKSDGVTQEQVDKFDFAWTDNENEPGDSPDAPYNKQHRIAMGIENLMAAALGVDWKAYERQLEDLPEVERKK